jgi:non-canonical (house-cleaning) NTP pyrophosphatase
MGDDQTRQGALNRACNARDRVAERGETADFFVGLEGGCAFEAPVQLPSSDSALSASFARPQELSCFAWGVVIKTGNSVVGAARTASFQLPDAVAQLVSQVIPTELSFVPRDNFAHREWNSALRMTRFLVESTANARAGRSDCCLVV